MCCASTKMVQVLTIHGIKIYVAKLGINPSTKSRNGKVYTYYTKRVILPSDFPGEPGARVYVLSEEDFKKFEKLLSLCALPELA